MYTSIKVIILQRCITVIVLHWRSKMGGYKLMLEISICWLLTSRIIIRLFLPLMIKVCWDLLARICKKIGLILYRNKLWSIRINIRGNMLERFRIWKLLSLNDMMLLRIKGNGNLLRSLVSSLFITLITLPLK